MQIFIDESGSFSGFHQGSIAAVGALSVPNANLRRLTKKYNKLRNSLPMQGGEVKGRTLNKTQIAKVAGLLLRNNVILKISVIDLSLHTAEAVSRYKDELVRGMTRRLPRFNASARVEVEQALQQLKETSVPLFLQAMTTFDLLTNIICHIPLYYSQRQPSELAEICWIVDGKDSARVTDWEKWWSWYAIGALSTRSRSNPMPVLEGADNTYFDRSYGGNTQTEGAGVNLRRLLSDVKFRSEPEPGLELIDIMTNAVRRAMMGRLAYSGWSEIPRLMIHRKHQYISLMRLEGASDEPRHPAYKKVLKAFCSGGKSMVSPRFRSSLD